jgi:hypothetical protein
MDNMAGNTMDVNIQSNGGYTPLHMAAINKSHKVTPCNTIIWLQKFSAGFCSFDDGFQSRQEYQGLQWEDCHLLPQERYHIRGGA